MRIPAAHPDLELVPGEGKQDEAGRWSEIKIDL